MMKEKVNKMNFKKFSKLLEARIIKTRQVLDAKNKEYSDGEDKLYNFKRASVILDCTPERALLGMKTKHDVSILDLVDKIEEGEFVHPDLLDEKIGDAINYLILLEALIKERQG